MQNNEYSYQVGQTEEMKWNIAYKFYEVLISVSLSSVEPTDDPLFGTCASAFLEYLRLSRYAIVPASKFFEAQSWTLNTTHGFSKNVTFCISTYSYALLTSQERKLLSTLNIKIKCKISGLMENEVEGFGRAVRYSKDVEDAFSDIGNNKSTAMVDITRVKLILSSSSYLEFLCGHLIMEWSGEMEGDIRAKCEDGSATGRGTVNNVKFVLIMTFVVIIFITLFLA